MQVVPYLMFSDQCAAAFRFYAELLGGEIIALQTHGESPVANEVPPDWHPLVIHARLKIGDQVLMGSDSPPEYREKAQGMYVSLQLDALAEARRVFDALAKGGVIKMPFEKTFWAAGFGMLVDRFGTPWMVNCEAG